MLYDRCEDCEWEIIRAVNGRIVRYALAEPCFRCHEHYERRYDYRDERG